MRIDRIHTLVHQLPPLNFKVLKTLVEHLTRYLPVSVDQNQQLFFV